MKHTTKKQLITMSIAILFVAVAISPALGQDNTTQPPSVENSEVFISLLADEKDKSTTISFDFSDFTFEDVEIGETIYQKITLSDESNYLEKGCPDIPNVRRSIIISDTAEMKIEVISSSFTEYDNVLLAPSKGSLKRDVNPADVAYTFSDIYSEDVWYPGPLAELDNPYILRDYRGQVVCINPIQYNGLTKTLRVYDHIEVRVSETDEMGSNILLRNALPAKVDNEYASVYSNHFLNYNTQTKYSPVGEQGNLLIITNSSFYNLMVPFMEWKIQKGIPTEMVNYSTVGSSVSDIETYVENYYNTDGLTYLLLVGDEAEIPAGYSSYGMSDISYGMISGSDHYPELFVGRFSAAETNPADLMTQINRTLDYEQNPQSGAAWYGKGVGIGSNEGTGDDGEYDWEHMHNIHTDLMGFTYTFVDEFYDSDHSSNTNDSAGNPTPSDVTAALNDGRSLVNYVGHGSTSGWSSSSFSTSDVLALTNDNMLPLVVCVACSNGVFSYEEVYCEAWLRATNDATGEPTGAIASWGASVSQAWSEPMDAQDEVVDLLVQQEKTTIGALLFNGAMHMLDAYNNNSNAMETMDTWILFGDPTVQLITTSPATLSVDHEDFLLTTADSFAVDVGSVEGALCALTSGRTIIGTAYTDASGYALIPIGVELEDIEEATLTVTAQNSMPYVVSLEVLPPVRQPAEFDPCQAVLVAYPLGIPAELVAEMSEDIEVITLINSASAQSSAETEYSAAGAHLNNCTFIVASHDSIWVRDYGPWWIYNQTASQLEVVDFNYNRPRPNDNAIPSAIASYFGLPLNYLPLDHTGGNYMTDGHGISASTTLLYTENSGTSPEDIDALMSEILGVTTYHVVDDVNGDYIEHIDCWGKFLSPETILIREVDSDHPQYGEIEDVVDYFEAQLNCYDEPYNVVRVYTDGNEPYTNSLILNEKVLVPIMGVNATRDNAALAAYQSAMPGYEVIGFEGTVSDPWESTDALHCRTKGIPDLGLLDIEHDPLTYMLPDPNGFTVEAEITSYSGASLLYGSPLLFWKNTSAGVWNSIQMTPEARNGIYSADIPSHPCGETISYYINAQDVSGRNENLPYIGAADPFEFSITLVPDIRISPEIIEVDNADGVIDSEILTITNDPFAGENLTYSLSTTDQGGFGWLSVDSSSGELVPDSFDNITVFANTTALSIGNYLENIIISSNDPDSPMITVPVNLTVYNAHDVGVSSIIGPVGTIPLGSYTVEAQVENYGITAQTGVSVNCTIYEGILDVTEDFDASNGGYSASGALWEWGSPSEGPSDAYSGLKCWGTNLDGEYTDSANEHLYSTLIDLSRFISPELTFYHWYDIEDGYSHYDGGNVKISTDGGTTWNLLGSYQNPYPISSASSGNSGISGEPCFTGTTTDWEQAVFDLSAYEGQTIMLDFHFGSDGSVKKDGWFIDDVTISSNVRNPGDIIYSGLTTVDVAALSSVTASFTPTWDPTELGNYTMIVKTELPTDQNTFNDASSEIVEVFQDIFEPTVTNIHDTPDPQLEGGEVTVSCHVEDPSGVSAVHIVLTGPAGFSPVNVSMSDLGSGQYSYTATYTLLGSYNYQIWTQDMLANSGYTTAKSFTIIDDSMMIQDYNLLEGWNLLTVPIDSSYNASSLASEIIGCVMISEFDGSAQSYNTYFVGGPASFDFVLDGGCAYFVLVDAATTFSLGGNPLLGVSVDLYLGWNSLGWYQQHNTTASSLAENITGAEMISWFDASSQSYNTYFAGGPGSFDFELCCGMGFFVLTDQSGIWHGEG